VALISGGGIMFAVGRYAYHEHTHGVKIIIAKPIYVNNHVDHVLVCYSIDLLYSSLIFGKLSLCGG